LVQDCGKDGVVAFRSTINRLNYLMFLAAKVSGAPRSGNLVHGFYTFRVQRSLQEVGQYLQLTQTEADKIRRREADDKPILTLMNQPLTLDLTTAKPVWPPPEDATLTPIDGVQVTVNGKYIQPGAIMRLISKHDPSQGFQGVTNPNSIAPTPNTRGTSILATFDLSSAPLHVLPAHYTIVVVNPDGQTAWLDDWFSITKADAAAGAALTAGDPVILSVSPSRLRVATLKTKGATLTIKGENLSRATELQIGTTAADALGTLVIISDSRAELTISPPGRGGRSPLKIGSYDISVTGGSPEVTDTLSDALIVRR
jgi:hypothetical protein